MQGPNFISCAIELKFNFRNYKKGSPRGYTWLRMATSDQSWLIMATGDCGPVWLIVVMSGKYE